MKTMYTFSQVKFTVIFGVKMINLQPLIQLIKH